MKGLSTILASSNTREGKASWWGDGHFEEHFKEGFDIPQGEEAANQRTQLFCQGARSVTDYVRVFQLLAGIPRPFQKGRRLHGKGSELGWTPTRSTWQKSVFSELSYQPHRSFIHPWNREGAFKFRNSTYVAWSGNANYHSQTPALLGWSRFTTERGSKRSESLAASKEAPDFRHVKGRGRNGGSQVLILVIDASCKLFYVPDVSPFLKRLTCTFQLCWIQETQQLCWINFKFSWRPPNMIKPLTYDYLNLI